MWRGWSNSWSKLAPCTLFHSEVLPESKPWLCMCTSIITVFIVWFYHDLHCHQFDIWQLPSVWWERMRKNCFPRSVENRSCKKSGPFITLYLSYFQIYFPIVVYACRWRWPSNKGSFSLSIHIYSFYNLTSRSLSWSKFLEAWGAGRAGAWW